MLFLDKDSGNVIFASDEMDIFSLGHSMSLDDVNIDEDDPETIIYIRLKTWRKAITAWKVSLFRVSLVRMRENTDPNNSEYEHILRSEYKSFKKNISQNGGKEAIEPIFTDKN